MLGIYDVRDYGAKGDGATNDLSALQAAVDAADAAGGGTVWLGPGTFNIGTGTWKIGQAAAQHHVNIEGINPITTRIVCNTSGGNAALYLNLEKYCTLKNFSVENLGARGGYGIQFGGDLGAGMQSNAINVTLVSVTNFNFGMYTSGGQGTSASITFDHCVFTNCSNGWYTSNFNALDFLLLMPEFNYNDVACFISTGNVQVIHGIGEFNKTDFYIAGGYDTNTRIEGFRSETNSTQPWLIAASNEYLSIDNCIIHANTSGLETIRIVPGANVSIRNTSLNGYIDLRPFKFGAVTLDHVSVFTPNTDWSLTNQLSAAYPAYGPGFRLNAMGQVGPADGTGTRIFIRSVYESSTGTMYPDVDAIGIQRPSDKTLAVVALNKGQGATVTISNNAVALYAYMHHVNDAGLIKTLQPVGGFGDLVTELLLIPDQPFTTDTTGNIGKASAAIVGQPMKFIRDLSNGKWYPSY